MAEIRKPGRGHIEQREFERIVAVLQIKYYTLDAQTAGELSLDASYKDTTLEKLREQSQVNSPMVGVTENISRGGLSLTGEEPLLVGQRVIVDMTLPGVKQPVRAMAEVMRSSGDSRSGVVDRNATSFKAGLKIVAVNKDDLRRVENFIISEKIKQRMTGR
jgi:hypothetical protein